MDKKDEVLNVASNIFGSMKTMMCAALILEQMMEFVELQYNDEIADVFDKYTPEEFAAFLMDKEGNNIKGEYRRVITLGILSTVVIAETNDLGKVTSVQIIGLSDAVNLDDEEKLEGFIWILLSSMVSEIKEFISKVQHGFPIEMEVHHGDCTSHVVIQKGKGRFRNVSYQDMCMNADTLFA